MGRSPREANGNPLQYSCLKNSMDRGAWWATVHGVTKSQTRLSHFTSRHFKIGGRWRALPKWPAGTFRAQGPAWDPVEAREEPLRFPHLPQEGNQFSKILRWRQILLSWSHVPEAGSVLGSFLEKQFAPGVKGTVPGPEVFVCSVAQLCPTLCDPLDSSPPGSSVHGILRARTLEWVAMPSFKSS